jgi:uncharacterized protein (TIGR02246 family)
MRRSGGSIMETVAQPTADAKAQIANVIAALADSWNRHDMRMYAAQFTEDADFVNVLGMHDHGRREIEARHEDVHRTIFRNSTLRTQDYSLRLLNPGVVLAHIRWEMTGHENPPGATFAPGVRRGVITGVFVEQEGRWLIAAFHNTEVVPITLPGRAK